jgi:hypothetical protein
LNERITVWEHKTANYTVWCEAELWPFVDPMKHTEAFIEAVNRDQSAVEHLHAFVSWRGHEVGFAPKLDCVYPIATPSISQDEGFHEIFRRMAAYDHILKKDRRHLYAVVRRAIANARDELSKLDAAELRLRNTA